MSSRPSISWLFVSIAYLAGISFVLLIWGQLASGYGFDFLGMGHLPNSPELRDALGIAAYVALAVCVVATGLALIRGPLWPRVAACLPAMMCLFYFQRVVLAWLN